MRQLNDDGCSPSSAFSSSAPTPSTRMYPSTPAENLPLEFDKVLQDELRLIATRRKAAHLQPSVPQTGSGNSDTDASQPADSDVRNDLVGLVALPNCAATSRRCFLRSVLSTFQQARGFFLDGLDHLNAADEYDDRTIRQLVRCAGFEIARRTFGMIRIEYALPIFV